MYVSSKIAHSTTLTLRKNKNGCCFSGLIQHGISKEKVRARLERPATDEDQHICLPERRSTSPNVTYFDTWFVDSELEVSLSCLAAIDKLKEIPLEGELSSNSYSLLHDFIEVSLPRTHRIPSTSPHYYVIFSDVTEARRTERGGKADVHFLVHSNAFPLGARAASTAAFGCQMH